MSRVPTRKMIKTKEEQKALKNYQKGKKRN